MVILSYTINLKPLKSKAKTVGGLLFLKAFFIQVLLAIAVIVDKMNNISS